MARRPHTHTLVSAVAACERCTWRVSGQNAQALAAQHYDAKRHPVRVTSVTEIIYGRASGKAGGAKERQENLL